MIVALAVAASCIVHVAVLAPVVVFEGEVREAPGARAITVDLVDLPQDLPQEVPPQAGDTAPADAVKPDPVKPDTAALDAPQPAPATAPAPAAYDAAPRALLQQPLPAAAAAATPPFALPPPPLPVPSLPVPPSPAPPSTAVPPAPAGAGDAGAPATPLTVLDGIAGGRTLDREAVDRADVAADVATAFFDHLRRCSKKPADVPATARVVVRVYLQPDGTLVAGLPQNPAPLKVSRGGGDLFVSAVAALRACQPYAMLPREQYPEWRTLDLTFTAQNF